MCVGVMGVAGQHLPGDNRQQPATSHQPHATVDGAWQIPSQHFGILRTRTKN